MEDEKKEVKQVSEIKDYARTSAKETSQIENKKKEIDQKRIELVTEVIEQIMENSIKNSKYPEKEIREIIEKVPIESDRQEIAKKLIKKYLDSSIQTSDMNEDLLYFGSTLTLLPYVPVKERDKLHEQIVQKLIDKNYSDIEDEMEVLEIAEERATHLGEAGVSLLLQIGKKYFELGKIEETKRVIEKIYQLTPNKKED